MPLWRTKNGKWRARWYQDGTAKGRRIMKTWPAHLTHSEADRLYKLELAKAAGRRGRTVPRDLTVAEAVAEYLASKKGAYAPQTFQGVSATFNCHVIPLLGPRRLASLVPSDFVGYQDTRVRENAAPSSINHEMQVIRTMLNTLIRWEWLERNPLPIGSVPRLKAPKNRTDFLTPDEWKAFLAAIEGTPDAKPSVFRSFTSARSKIPVFQFLLFTGARLGEALSLRWEAVDLDRGRITLNRPKTSSVTGLMISDPLRAVLEALPRGTPRALVFTRPDGDPWEPWHIQDAFYRARDRAGLRDSLSVHSLRHSFASWLVGAGIQLKVVAELLGHASLEMTNRYAHLAPEHLKEAVDQIGRIEASGKVPVANGTPPKPSLIHLGQRRKA